MIPYSDKYDYNLESEKSQWIQDNKHLCIVPYIESDTRPDHINPCCHYSKPSDTFDFDNPNNRIIKIKNNIESNAVDENCHHCHNQEANNQISTRVRQFLQHSSTELTEWLTTKKTNEYTNVITFGNKCNMACRMCSPRNSNLYESIWLGKKLPYKNMSDEPRLWEVLKSNIRDQHAGSTGVYRIIVMGGEGTVQEDLYKLTDWLIDEKLSNKINLQIATNGSVFLDEVFEKWCKNFKHLSFSISVDSAHVDNFQYVRYPVKFAKINNNLQNFKNLSNRLPNLNFFITPTFYINNIAYLKDFLDYFEKFDEAGVLSIRDNSLFRPSYLRVGNLPMAIKQQLLDQITPLVNAYGLLDRNEMFKTSINSMLEQFKIDSFSMEDWKQYLSTTAKWDKLTNTDISFHNKKLWDLLSDDDKALYYQYKNKHNDLSN